MAKGGHICAGLLTSAIISLITLSMSSGRSFMTLKANVTGLPTISYPYGVGVLYDSYGYTWVEEESFFGGNDCKDHQHRGQYVKAVAFMVTLMCVFGVIVHALGAWQGAAWQGLAGVGIQAFNLIFLITGLGVGANFYDTCLWCKTMSAKLCVKDFFYLNYAIPFVVTAIILTLINLVALIAGGSMAGVQPEPEAEEGEGVKSTEPAA